MTTALYAIYDNKMGFQAPVAFTGDRNDQYAERWFRSVLAQEESIMHNFAADFSLYYLGQFSNDSGYIKMKEKPEYILGGLKVVKNNAQS